MRKSGFILPLLLAALAWAANVKLYLTDGGYHLVREYQVQSDRVRYYSVERDEWEEIPLDLVDLKRTRAEVEERSKSVVAEEKIIAEESAAEKAVKAEVRRIPQDPGAYWLDGKETRVMKPGEEVVHSNKGRSILQVLTPVPVLTGKATLEMSGPHASIVFTDPQPEFYVQLAATEGFGIARLTTKGNIRIVENLTYHPIDKTMVEEDRVLVDILHRQLADGLYKIWPKDPLDPGEYAVVLYTDGKVDIQSFDFAVKAK